MKNEIDPLTRCGTRNGGFTLIEVLIALAILAIALAAAARATGQSTSASEQVRLRLLASWTAQNRMAEHYARRDWPEIGVRTGEAQQGGIPLKWEERISETPNTNFKRIEILINLPDTPEHQAARLIGYLVKP